MKHIVKNPEPSGLGAFKAKANPDWQPSFDAMSGTLKRTLHDALVNEQGWICCYCNQRIDRSSSHIEHLRPGSRFPADDLTYENLLASCPRDDQPGEPLHCGKLKGDWFDASRLISPLQPDCETRFRFTADGEVRPADGDPAAQETVQRLGLNLRNSNDSAPPPSRPSLQTSPTCPPTISADSAQASSSATAMADFPNSPSPSPV